MKINDKIRIVMKEERFRSVDFGPVFNCAPNVAASRFYNGIATICDLVKIMAFMGGEVIIRSHNGTEIPLTVDDVMADKAERKQRYIRYTTKKSPTAEEADGKGTEEVSPVETPAAASVAAEAVPVETPAEASVAAETVLEETPAAVSAVTEDVPVETPAEAGAVAKDVPVETPAATSPVAEPVPSENAQEESNPPKGILWMEGIVKSEQ